MKRGSARSLALAALAALSTLSMLVAQASSAALIFDGLVGPQDIAAFQVAIDYSAATDRLSAQGTAAAITLDGVTPFGIAGGSFDLSATIDDAGVLSAGTLQITGTAAGLGFNSGTLLVGEVVAVGFQDAGGDPLQFLVDITGGDAQSSYPAQTGVVLTFTDFPGDFSADFSNNPDAGLANTSPIPEPTTGALLGLGLALVAARRGRRT